MTHILEPQTSQSAPKQSTCAQCPYFESYEEESGRGTCHNFDQVVRSHNLRADVCDHWGEPIPFSINDLEEIRVAVRVKLIDPEEPPSEWAAYNLILIKYNHARYRNDEAWLNETDWTCQVQALDRSYQIWVSSGDICHSDKAERFTIEGEF